MAPSGDARTRWRNALVRRKWWYAGGTAAITAAILTWTLWPTSTPEPPRARQYTAFTACLLTGEHGITDPDATPAWAGLQQASLTTHAKVQYLAITGPQTPDNGATFVATLSQTGCDLIFAAGTIPIRAVNNAAPNFPNTHFYIIHGTTTQPNVSIVDSQTADGITASINQLVTKSAPTPPAA